MNARTAAALGARDIADDADQEGAEGRDTVGVEATGTPSAWKHSTKTSCAASSISPTSRDPRQRAASGARTNGSYRPAKRRRPSSSPADAFRIRLQQVVSLS
ncbi:MAG: hypothetical protein WKF75_06190 [Singulisphaera sp.]